MKVNIKVKKIKKQIQSKFLKFQRVFHKHFNFVLRLKLHVNQEYRAEFILKSNKGTK